MSIERINEQELIEQGRWHSSLPNVPGKSAEDMQEFFDYIPKEVIIPKLNEVIDAQHDNGDISQLLELKADKADVYSKEQVDLLIEQADRPGAADCDGYNKTEVDALLAVKADKGTLYTKWETDSLLADKADVQDTITRAECEVMVSKKANKNDVYSKSETYSKGEINELLSGEIKMYGVRRSLNSSSPYLERIWDAQGLSADVGADDIVPMNDFDSIYPWSEIRVCNIDVSNGITVTAYKGQPGFKADGSNGEVAVEIPKFYQYYKKEDGHEYFGVCRFMQPGWYLNPAFVTESGRELDRIYIGAYLASYDIARNCLRSVSGGFPDTRRTRADFRELARSLSPCTHLYDLANVDILRTLFTVEFATLNSQEVMMGQSTMYSSTACKTLYTRGMSNCCDISSGYVDSFEVGMHMVFRSIMGTVLSDIYKITDISYYEDGEGAHTDRITITFEGESYNVTSGLWVYPYYAPNGACDNVLAPSGSVVNTQSPRWACKYRGIENPWGAVCQIIDGIGLNNYHLYICTNPSEYADLVYGGKHKDTGVLLSHFGGMIDEITTPAAMPFAKVPIGGGGSTTTYFCDDHNAVGDVADIDNSIAMVGGNISRSDMAGIWAFDTSYDNTRVGDLNGTRLCWKPIS